MALDPIFSDAVIFASLLSLLSIGLTLTYLTTRVPNFAHASFATIGVYMALVATHIWGVTPYVSIPVAFVVSGLVAVSLYVFILKPLIRKGASQAILMIATLAFDLILIAGLNIFADFVVQTFRIASREFTLRSYDAELMGLPLIVFAAPATIAVLSLTLYIVLKKTKFGIAMRGRHREPGSLRDRGDQRKSHLRRLLDAGRWTCRGGGRAHGPVVPRGSELGPVDDPKRLCR